MLKQALFFLFFSLFCASLSAQSEQGVIVISEGISILDHRIYITPSFEREYVDFDKENTNLCGKLHTSGYKPDAMILQVCICDAKQLQRLRAGSYLQDETGKRYWLRSIVTKSKKNEYELHFDRPLPPVEKVDCFTTDGKNVVDFKLISGIDVHYNNLRVSDTGDFRFFWGKQPPTPPCERCCQ